MDVLIVLCLALWVFYGVCYRFMVVGKWRRPTGKEVLYMGPLEWSVYWARKLGNWLESVRQENLEYNRKVNSGEIVNCVNYDKGFCLCPFLVKENGGQPPQCVIKVGAAGTCEFKVTALEHAVSSNFRF